MRGRLLPLLLSLLLLAGCAGKPYSAQVTAMDTYMRFTVYGGGGGEAVRLAREKVLELDGLLSVTDENSEIYAANHAGGASVKLSGDTAALLERALELCRSTGGALDVTIYPVVRSWGFTTDAFRVPEAGELEALLERVDYTQVKLDGRTLTLPAGVELDLGAVAKGYAGDCLAALLADLDVDSALLELGGNIHTVGTKPDGSPWRIAVTAPDGSGQAAVLEVTDKAVVTSGGYERYFEQDGEIYWHIIDPSTGYPARTGLRSVTVVADEGVVCDALSTAFFVMGAGAAASYWREHGGFDFLLISDSGTVTITEGLEAGFSLSEAWANHTLEILRR